MITLRFSTPTAILRAHPHWDWQQVFNSFVKYFFPQENIKIVCKTLTSAIGYQLKLTYQDIPSDEMVLAVPGLVYIYCDFHNGEECIGVALTAPDNSHQVMRRNMNCAALKNILHTLNDPTKTQTLTPSEEKYFYDSLFFCGITRQPGIMMKVEYVLQINGKAFINPNFFYAFRLQFNSLCELTPYAKLLHLIAIASRQEHNDHLQEEICNFLPQIPNHGAYALLAEAIHLDTALEAAGLRVPARFICVITKTLITNAVCTTAAPNTYYENQALLQWLASNKLVDPTTRKILPYGGMTQLPQHSKLIRDFLTDFVRGVDLKKYLDSDDFNALPDPPRKKIKSECKSGPEDKHGAPAATASLLQRQGVFSQHPIDPSSIPDIAPTVLEENLRIAATDGKIDVVRSLIAQRVNVNARHPVSGLTALRCARRNNQADCERLLLANGAIEHELSSALAT